MTEISEEQVVAEARVLATSVVHWFRERLQIAEAERDVADEERVAAEDHQKTAEVVRDHAQKLTGDAVEQRNRAQRQVVEVEELLAASGELAEQLQRALESRIVIEQAKGFLAARHSVTPDAAFEAMRRHARSNRRVLRDVAQEIVLGKSEFTL